MAFHRCGGGVDTSMVTAGAEDVLSPKVIVNADGEQIAGTMVNQGAKTATLSAGGSYTIPKGFHNGSGKVTANTLSSQTIADATASDIKKGKTAWVNGTKLTGTKSVTVDGKEVTGNLVLNSQIADIRLDDLPHQCSCAIEYKGELHLFGSGYSESGKSRKHYKWNGRTFTEVSTLPDPTKTFSYQFAVYNNKLYYLSSYALYEFNENTASWTKLFDNPGTIDDCPLVPGDGVYMLAIFYNDYSMSSGTYSIGELYRFTGTSWTKITSDVNKYGIWLPDRECSYCMHEDKLYELAFPSGTIASVLNIKNVNYINEIERTITIDDDIFLMGSSMQVIGDVRPVLHFVGGGLKYSFDSSGYKARRLHYSFKLSTREVTILKKLPVEFMHHRENDYSVDTSIEDPRGCMTVFNDEIHIMVDGKHWVLDHKIYN